MTSSLIRLCILGDSESIHFQRWVNYFVSSGRYKISVISCSAKPFKEAFHYRIKLPFALRSEGGNFQYLFKARQIKKIIRTEKPNLLVSHYLSSYGLLGAISGWQPHLAVAWGSDVLLASQRGWIYRKILQYTFSRTDVLIADAQEVSRRVQQLGMPGSKVVTIPMGVETEIFAFRAPKTTQSPRVHILSNRALIANSNTELIIQAFANFCTHYQETELTILNVGPELPRLKKITNDLNLTEKVKFLGYCERSEMVTQLRRSDLFVSIPTSDATSVSLLEAMAVGLFPIVSDLPANRQWISHPENGIVLSRLTPAALAEAFQQAISSYEKWPKVAEKNREIITTSADWFKNMQTVEGIIQQLTMEKRRTTW